MWLITAPVFSRQHCSFPNLSHCIFSPLSPRDSWSQFVFPQLLAFLADQPTFKVMISSPGGPEVEKGVGWSGCQWGWGGGWPGQRTSQVINSLTKRGGQMGGGWRGGGLVQEPRHKSPALIAPVYYL